MLKVEAVSFQYTASIKTLQGIDFSLNEGAVLCVMGESGCGKSTLLKLIYGLLGTNKGNISWKDQPILGPEYHLVPGMPFIKHVAQDFDLMPFTTVSENIGKFLSRFYPEEKEVRTKELLEMIEMSDFAHIKVKNLSGGQQQRVAIARALAKEPELLLLDEPFGQIDNFKRNSLRRNLFHYLKEKNITCIIATHDGTDALSFADNLIVLRDHQIIENGTPMAIYSQPKSKYIAALFDDVNELSYNGQDLLLYPHELCFIEKSGLKGVVKRSFFKGFYWVIEVDCLNQILFIKNESALPQGLEVFLEIKK